ncbi:MAG TPA: family 16 glycoside hydrolase [Terracidiphilus sp.]|jgi:hypothetical protein|nr:family 16 glycoside hydrolase [Terracidiphilus sp.]
MVSDRREHVEGFRLKRGLIRDLVVFLLAAAAGAGMTAGAIHMVRSPSRGLPYHDDFANSDASEWTAYDGNWNVHSGVMVNESNERGAKLVSGSPYWTNYALDADISLSSSGDAGILTRVSDAEPGVDSYRGLYGGLRVRDQMLVFGVANHAWDEAPATRMPRPILPNVWYHIRMEVRGCHVNLAANEENSSDKTQMDMTLLQCPERGKIGLRSYDSGGQWKNIRVTALP